MVPIHMRVPSCIPLRTSFTYMHVPTQAAVDSFVKKGEPPSNIAVHAASLESYTSELRDALALATLLRRTLVLPRWTCYCDRLWSGSDDIFHFGCMYPGAQDGKFVPFTCPMDHVLSPAAWERSSVHYRDPAFLSSRRWIERQPTTADVQVVTRLEYEGRGGVGGLALPLGASSAEAVRALSAASASVLRLPHTRGLLCDVGDAETTRSFNQRSSNLLRVPQWCAKCFQPCASELSKWLSTDVIRRCALVAHSFVHAYPGCRPLCKELFGAAPYA